MKKIFFLLINFLLIGMFLNACSSKILLPYEENSLCEGDKKIGYCGSVSDVYKYLNNELR